MFYIYRVIIALLVVAWMFLLFFVIGKSCNKKAKNNKYIRISIKKRIGVISFFLLTYTLVLFVLCNIPFEAPFVKFDTVEESLSYKWIDTNGINVFDYNDCAFVVGKEDRIYSILKVDNKYFMVDFCAKDAQYYQENLNQDFRNFINAKHNRVTNKTFYTVVVNERKGATQPIVYMNESSIGYTKSYITTFPDPFPNKVSLYSIMLEGGLLEQFDICSNGSKTTFRLS